MTTETFTHVLQERCIQTGQLLASLTQRWVTLMGLHIPKCRIGHSPLWGPGPVTTASLEEEVSGGAKSTLHSVRRGAETVKEELSGEPSQNGLPYLLWNVSLASKEKPLNGLYAFSLPEAKPCSLWSRTHAFCSGIGPPLPSHHRKMKSYQE